MGLLNKTSKIDTIVPEVTSYGWYGDFVDDAKIVKNMEVFNEWRFNMRQLYVDCKTNPVLDKKIIEDIIKSMTL